MRLKDGFKGSRSFVFPRDITEWMEKDPIIQDLFITDIGYYPVAKYHYRERLKGCSQNVLLYCTDGSGWCTINDKRYQLHTHQFIVLPANTPHAYGADLDSPWSIYWVHFTGFKADYFAQNLVGVKGLYPSENSRLSDRINLFEEIFNTLINGYNKDNIYYATACFHHFLGSLVYTDKYREGQKRQEVNIVEKSIHYMNENIERKITLQELADNISYSSSHYSTLFHAQTGYSPLNYFMRLKIQKSCKLLEFSNMKVYEIAYKLGFEDSFYFCRVFTKIMGISPSKFRNR